MIFVTVGTARDFSRLIKKIDEIAVRLKERVVIQKGCTKYEPKNCKYFDWIPREEFLNYIKKAKIVITHGGVGTILLSLSYNKPTIVVPRRKKYNEHRNDHQMDIAKELEKDNSAFVCYDVDDLEKIIKKARRFKVKKIKKEKEKLERALDDFIKGVK